MEITKIYPDPRDDSFFIEAYVTRACKGYVRKALVICPGGAYKHLSDFREGEAVAAAFLPHGYNCFVLHYSVAESGKVFPAQLLQAAKTVAYVRSHAEELRIDPEHICICGFSAGGHLAGSLAVLWDRPYVQEVVGEACRPNGAMLIYPVITPDPELGGHRNSFRNLLGIQEPTEVQLEEVTLNKQVTETAAPAFLVHTTDDQAVGVCNSLVLAEAYAKAGVPFELHIYTGAKHGVALANPITNGESHAGANPNIAKWVELAARWAETL